MNDQGMNWGDFGRVHFRHFVHTEDAGENQLYHYRDVMMDTMASQITSLTIVFSTVYAGADQRKHQNSTSLALWGEVTGDRWITQTRAH